MPTMIVPDADRRSYAAVHYQAGRRAGRTPWSLMDPIPARLPSAEQRARALPAALPTTLELAGESAPLGLLGVFLMPSGEVAVIYGAEIDPPADRKEGEETTASGPGSSGGGKDAS